jgi:N,N'-diacetyllegionaminate synthase
VRTLIIAEVGVNHNGEIELAKKLIAAAAQAGADWVKFQSFKAKNLVSTFAPKAEYQTKTTGSSGNQLQMLQQLELSLEDHVHLIEECKTHKIGFFSSAFDFESFDMLDELGCLEQIKIPSGEITNLPLLRHVSRFCKPLMLSTGMANLGEIEEAIRVIEATGTSRQLITVLHCTTDYPTPIQDVNLRAMMAIKTAFGVNVGYSDHTPGIEIPIAAVALGANVIEKHFTLNRNLPGPDHKASLEPQEFKAMVDGIRNVERALGNGVKCPSPSEMKNRAFVRKSLVAICPIIAGDIFSAKNVGVKRPGTGLSPMLWDDVVGRTATKDFAVDELITL